MKLFKSLIILIAAITFFSCSEELKFNGKFSYSPASPQSSDNINVMYLPDSTMFKDVPGIRMFAYMYGKELINTIEVPMNRKEKGWTANFKPDESALGIVIKFRHDQESDNNNKKGFVINLHDGSGKILKGSRIALAGGAYSWGYYADIEPDNDMVKQLIDDELKAYPDAKHEYIDDYLKFLSRTEKEKGDSLIKIELTEFEKTNPDDEYGTEALYSWYSRIKETGIAEKYLSILKEKYPQCKSLQTDRYRKFRAEIDVTKKLELASQFEKDFPKSDYIVTLYDLIANDYRDSKKYNEAYEYLKANKNKPSGYRFYAVVNRMIDEKASPEIAMEIIKLGVERNREDVKNPKGEKPEYYSHDEWKEDREYILGLNLRALGKLQSDGGNNTEAESSLKEAVALTKGKESSINEQYAKVLIDLGKNKEAIDEISSHIKKGTGTVEMKNLLKTAYVKDRGSDAGFDEYLSSFEVLAKELMIDKLKKDMVSTPAPDFKLTDLEGKQVSLKELKGKVVIIDFWATWCGPCLQSFPGMQKAVEKYSDNNNVKFLFINSWENVVDKEQNAVDFISKTKYPFRVLLDLDNKVIESFKVTGIPTKFIIDKAGNTRFVSVGFNGNPDVMVDELSTMIGMLL
ncbi:MAG: TlpA family protein disulfide reductase [Ignavibacteriales bacterium]|nr:MAG: TlpA family protein disulfide reductase [Ignavibacteriales bacterium]